MAVDLGRSPTSRLMSQDKAKSAATQATQASTATAADNGGRAEPGTTRVPDEHDDLERESEDEESPWNLVDSDSENEDTVDGRAKLERLKLMAVRTAARYERARQREKEQGPAEVENDSIQRWIDDTANPAKSTNKHKQRQRRSELVKQRRVKFEDDPNTTKSTAYCGGSLPLMHDDDEPTRHEEFLKQLLDTNDMSDVLKQFRNRFLAPSKLGIDCLTGAPCTGGVLQSMLFEAEREELLVNQGDEWIDVEFEVALDSGCTDHVCDPEDTPGYLIEQSSGSKRNQHFLVGNGERIKNQGQLRLNLQHEADGAINNIDSTFQAAKVSRPLMSVGRICDAGMDVTFTKTGAKILSQEGQVLCTFERQGGGLYLAKLRLKKPFVRHG